MSSTGTPARVIAMHEAYESGKTLEQVGDRFGLSRERVRQLLKAYGYSTRTQREAAGARRAATLARADEILAAYESLGDATAVAAQLGVTMSVVREVLLEAERTDPRPASDSRRKRRRPRKRWSDEELLDCLREASRTLGGVLSADAYGSYARDRRLADGRPWPGDQCYRLRFGSWREALGHAGLRANPSSPIRGQRLFEPEHCVDAVRHVARQLGHPPTAAEYEKYARESLGALPSLATVRQRSGSWLGALRAAGL